jgi:single-stranded-DNA-specific exonuclease
MACGVTIAADRIDALADFLEERLAADVARRNTWPRAAARRGARARRASAPPCATRSIGGGPYGAGWPAPRVAAGPVRIVKADVVRNAICASLSPGDDGRRIKAIAFRMADSPLG